jgi:hypothetical protein
MDTQAAGTQFAKHSHQKTITLQAGIIANQQKAIDVANVRIGDLVEANATLEKTIQWYRDMRTEGMGAAARADIADGTLAAPAAPAEQAEQAEPQKFDDYPEFHQQAMGCGLEDRGITDRYEAMRYGWDEAVESVAERINLFLSDFAAPVAPLPEQTGPSVEDDPEFDDLIGKLAKANTSSEWDEGKACREWRDELVAYIDRRLAASPSPAPAQQQEPCIAFLEARLTAITKWLEQNQSDVSTGAQMKAYPCEAPLEFTGRTAERTISHIQTGYGLADGWCILSFAPVIANGGQILTDAQVGEIIATWARTSNSRFELCRAIEAATLRASLAAPAIPTVDRNAVAEEGAEILGNMIESIEKHGNYSQEATLTFLAQAKQCFDEIKSAAPGVAQPAAQVAVPDVKAIHSAVLTLQCDPNDGPLAKQAFLAGVHRAAAVVSQFATPATVKTAEGE